MLRVQIKVVDFQYLDFVAAALQSAGEPSTGLALLDRYSVIALGDLTRVRHHVQPTRAKEKN